MAGKRKRYMATKARPTVHGWEAHMVGIFGQPETWTPPASVKVSYSRRTSIGVYRGVFHCPDGERPTVIVRFRIIGGVDRPERVELISREVRLVKAFRAGQAA